MPKINAIQLINVTLKEQLAPILIAGIKIKLSAALQLSAIGTKIKRTHFVS
jgi:hypothetical protein